MNGSADENPYRSPKIEESILSPSTNVRQLRYIARFQRHVIVALALNLALLIFAAFFEPLLMSIFLLPLLLLFILVLTMYAMWAVFLLAQELFGTMPALVFAMLMSIPIVSSFILFLINSKASSELKRYGVEVGFLGVNPRSIQVPKQEAVG